MKTLHMCLLHALLPRQSGPLVSLQIPLVYINTLVFGLVYSGEESPNILSVKYAFSWVFMGIMELKELAVFQVLKELDSDDIKTMEISLISGYAKREFHSNADSQDKYYRTMDSTSRWLTVETNCLSLVQGFMSLPNLEDIQMLSHNFASLSFSHVKRESNVVAHATSRLADPKTWTQDAPHSIKIVAFSSKAL